MACKLIIVKKKSLDYIYKYIFRCHIIYNPWKMIIKIDWSLDSGVNMGNFQTERWISDSRQRFGSAFLFRA